MNQSSSDHIVSDELNPEVMGRLSMGSERAGPFFFGIPLRSAATAADWPKVEALVDDTIASALAQTGADVRVLLACHDIPAIPSINDPRVTVVQAPFPTPTNAKEQLRDKGWKKRLITVELRKQGGGFLMWLDADDLVSSQLAAYALQDDNPFGYYIASGYSLCGLTNRLRPIKKDFQHFCGSCTILRLSTDDLPETFDPNGTAYSSQFKDHGEHRSLAERTGRPLARVPFPAVVYKINTGENHSAFIGKRKGIAKNLSAIGREMLLNKLLKRLPSERVKREFHIRDGAASSEAA